jgi:hypothetical protein
MSPRAPTRSGPVLGIALTPASITAAGRTMPAVWRRELELNGGSNGAVERLQAALGEAARASGAQEPSAVVALLSPLVELRTISLPPLSAEDRNRFLSRNASRYFVSARGAQVIGSLAPPAPKGSATGPVLAAAASQQLLGAVQAAASAAQLPVVAVVPAESAWAAAALEIWPALEQGAAGIVVTRDDRTDLITTLDGEIRTVRRFRGAADAAEIVAAASDGAGGARIGVLGTTAASLAMVSALSAQGARVLTPDAQWRALSEHPDALAARFAPQASGLEIRTDESREVERAEIGRLARRGVGVAALLLVLAGLVHYQGVKRELSRVQAARAELRPRVEQTLVGRSSVETAYRQVAGLARISREAPRWSSVIAAITAQLSDAAALTAFRARGDSIFLDGVADEAAPVFDDIARTPGVSGVRATAPVRREHIEGEVPLEHFAIGAQIVPRVVPAAMAGRPR